MTTLPSSDHSATRGDELTEATAHRVLVVDDDELVAKAVARALEHLGYDSSIQITVEGALTAAETGGFDVVVADIQMPGTSGIDMLRLLRERDVDCPALLMTGAPTLESATAAFGLGVVQYLAKPVTIEALRDALALAVEQSTRIKRQRVALGYLDRMQHEAREAVRQSRAFEQAMEGLWLAFQPIVSWSARRVVACEALLRSKHPELSHPEALLAEAERLGREREIGRRVRRLAAAALPRLPAGTSLFVNLHPRELLDPDLFDPEQPLSRVADRVVLEITERASLGATVPELFQRLQRLRALRYRVAVDDLGTGYSGLSALASLAPDVVKIDMSLIRRIDGDSTKHAVVKSLVDLCGQLGITVISEGIETAAERSALVRLGCDQLQGFFFARPSEDLGVLDSAGAVLAAIDEEAPPPSQVTVSR